jgi:mannose-6-phosphate isomerase-like protein (cupin superfamily)
MLFATGALAQPAAPAAPPPDKTFISAAEVQALMAGKKNAPLVGVGTYRPNMEYRTGVQTASFHENTNELIYVIDGSANFTLGGSLVDPKPGNNGNISGTGITGGTTQKLEKGAVVFVPANTPHQFTEIQGAMVDMSFHVPRVPAAAR